MKLNQDLFGTINIGSRSSKLALIQTNLVLEKLKLYYDNNLPSVSKDLRFNITEFTTVGDKILDKPLPEIGAKSLFTKELEQALVDGQVDFVVHSLKDLPTTLPEGCVIGAVMKREDPNDAIVLRKSLATKIDPLDLLLGKCNMSGLEELKIGTSSQRRIAMVRRINERLECTDIRGNLNTRLAKLDNDEGEFAAIILAKAGLSRMSWSERISATLSPEVDSKLSDWCYAVGQGAIAVECRSDDVRIASLLRPIVDLQTTYETMAERSLMRKLEGGCSVPLGVRSTWTDELTLSLEGIVLSLDGKSIVRSCDSVTLTTFTHVGSSEKHDNIKIENMTGMTLPQEFLSQSNVHQNLIRCSELGISVANKMINAGCLKLMSKPRS